MTVEAVLFVGGALVLGAILGARWRAPRRARPSMVPTVEAPARARLPITMAHAESHVGALDDQRFSGLLRDALADVARQHGAAAAVLWRVREGALVRERVTGDAAAVPPDADGLVAMASWAVTEGLALLGPDAEAPTIGIGPLAAAGERATGAIGVFFTGPYAEDRAALKQWLLRHGTRLRLLDELLDARHELARTNKRIRTILREVQQWDVASPDEGLGARYCELVERLLLVDGAALVRWDERAQSGQVVAAHGACAVYLDHTVVPDSLVAEACRENVPGIWHDVSGRDGPMALIAPLLAPERGCVLVQPLRRRSEVIGAVVAVHGEPGALSPADLRTLSLVDATATSRLVASWRLAEVSQRALVDGLTGLANRRGFEAAMLVAREEAERHRWQVSLLLIDVDHFKAVNDTYGHEAGDHVLHAIAGTLNDRVRELDHCARVGGEEFAIVLKNTSGVGAAELANRLRVAVEAQRVSVDGTELQVTASFGVATYPDDVADWETLYRSADTALYEAKHAGRNRVRLFREPPFSTDDPLENPA